MDFGNICPRAIQHPHRVILEIKNSRTQGVEEFKVEEKNHRCVILNLIQDPGVLPHGMCRKRRWIPDRGLE